MASISNSNLRVASPIHYVDNRFQKNLDSNYEELKNVHDSQGNSNSNRIPGDQLLTRNKRFLLSTHYAAPDPFRPEVHQRLKKACDDLKENVKRIRTEITTLQLLLEDPERDLDNLPFGVDRATAERLIEQYQDRETGGEEFLLNQHRRFENANDDLYNAERSLRAYELQTETARPPFTEEPDQILSTAPESEQCPIPESNMAAASGQCLNTQQKPSNNHERETIKKTIKLIDDLQAYYRARMRWHDNKAKAKIIENNSANTFLHKPVPRMEYAYFHPWSKKTQPTPPAGLLDTLNTYLKDSRLPLFTNATPLNLIRAAVHALQRQLANTIAHTAASYLETLLQTKISTSPHAAEWAPLQTISTREDHLQRDAHERLTGLNEEIGAIENFLHNWMNINFVELPLRQKNAIKKFQSDPSYLETLYLKRVAEQEDELKHRVERNAASFRNNELLEKMWNSKSFPWYKQKALFEPSMKYYPPNISRFEGRVSSNETDFVQRLQDETNQLNQIIQEVTNNIAVLSHYNRNRQTVPQDIREQLNTYSPIGIQRYREMLQNLYRMLTEKYNVLYKAQQIKYLHQFGPR